MFTKIFLGLGSNLGKSSTNIFEAVKHLNAEPSIQNTKLSPLYFTPPMGPQDQPDFINAVLQAETLLTPSQLLEKIKFIEKKMGREATLRWGPRIIDIDILLYGEQIIHTSELSIPHIGISERIFVLYPLADLDKQLKIPGLGPLTELIDHLGNAKIHKI